MFVRDRMTSPAVTVHPDTPYQEAMRYMREKRFRRLPVVGGTGQLVGIVSERDLLHASPSPATSLSIWEINYLLWQLRVEQLMTTRVVTAHPDMPIEEAARLMVEHRIGGLPVMDDGGHVVGVITETDIFRAFTELFGTHESHVRVVIEREGESISIGTLVNALEHAGGTVKHVSVYSPPHDAPAQPAGSELMLLRVSDLGNDSVQQALVEAGGHVRDIRTSHVVTVAADA